MSSGYFEHEKSSDLRSTLRHIAGINDFRGHFHWSFHFFALIFISSFHCVATLQYNGRKHYIARLPPEQRLLVSHQLRRPGVGTWILMGSRCRHARRLLMIIAIIDQRFSFSRSIIGSDYIKMTGRAAAGVLRKGRIKVMGALFAVSWLLTAGYRSISPPITVSPRFENAVGHTASIRIYFISFAFGTIISWAELRSHDHCRLLSPGHIESRFFVISILRSSPGASFALIA